MSSSDDVQDAIVGSVTGATDHLGRELDTGTGARTVTEFAVQQGTVEDTPDVRDAIEADQKRAEQHTERAQQLSDQLNASPPATPVEPEEDPQE